MALRDEPRTDLSAAIDTAQHNREQAIAVTSHELRSPITVIKVAADVK